VDVCVNVKLTVPKAIPVTKPAFVTVATLGALLTQVPPVVGERVVVNPAHTVDGPVNATTGGTLTVTGAVLSETQPVASVK